MEYLSPSDGICKIESWPEYPWGWVKLLKLLKSEIRCCGVNCWYWFGNWYCAAGAFEYKVDRWSRWSSWLNGIWPLEVLVSSNSFLFLRL